MDGLRAQTMIVMIKIFIKIYYVVYTFCELLEDHVFC